jgi:hypothetical protein
MLQFPAAHMEQLLDGRFFLDSIPIDNLVQKVSLGITVHLHCVSVPFDCILKKDVRAVSVICCNFCDSTLQLCELGRSLALWDQIWTNR